MPQSQMNSLAVNYVRPVMMISYAIIMLIFESLLFFTPLVALVPYIVFLLSSFANFFAQLFSKLYFPFSLISHPFYLFSNFMFVFDTFFGLLSSTYFGILTMLFFAYFPMIVLAVIYVLILGSNVTINDNKDDTGRRRNVGSIWPNANWPANAEYSFWDGIMNILDHINGNNWPAGGGWWSTTFWDNLFNGFVDWREFGMGWNGPGWGYHAAMNWVRNHLLNFANNIWQDFGAKFMRRLLNLARKVLNRRWQPYPNVGHANAITSWENMVDALEQIVAPPAPPVLQGKRAQPSTHDFNHIVTDVIILLLCIIFFFIMRSYILHILFVILVTVCAKYI